MTHSTFFALAFVGGVTLGAACMSAEPETNHCSSLDGDATCAERYGDSLPYCGGDCVDSVHHDGCVGDVPVACYYPCGQSMLADENLDCVGATETNASLESTGDPSGDPTTNADTSSATDTLTSGEMETIDDTGPQGCQSSGECMDTAAPVCLDYSCVPCTDTPDSDMTCASKDPNRPVCADDGQCVQCNAANAAACTDTTPLCDADTSTCVGCTYHEQCPDTACNIADGACIDGDVFHVDGDPGCDNSGPGSAATPFCDIQVGIDAIAAEGVVIVHAAGSYSEALTVDGGASVAVLAAGTDRPNVTYIDGGPTLQLSGAGTTLYVEGLRFAGNNSAVALSLAEGQAWLDRLEVVTNAGSGAGISATDGARVTVRGSVVGRNGEEGNNAPFGLHAEGAMTELHLQNVTAVANLGPAGSSLTCDSNATVTVRNSIVAKSALDSIGCSTAGVTYSAIDTDIAGTGVELLDTYSTGWFVDFFSNDYRLSVSGLMEFADVALVAAGDYPFDFEGDPRPAPGAMDYAGADTP